MLEPVNGKGPLQFRGVGGLAPKIGELLEYASHLGINALIVARDQDGLDTLAPITFPEGAKDRFEFYYSYKNKHTQALHRVLVIRALDVADAVNRLSRAHTANVVRL
jgi:hypothetical protein